MDGHLWPGISIYSIRGPYYNAMQMNADTFVRHAVPTREQMLKQVIFKG